MAMQQLALLLLTVLLRGYRAAHLLVFAGGDLLQEVSDALALGAHEALLLEELHHVVPGPVVHDVPCRRRGEMVEPIFIPNRNSILSTSQTNGLPDTLQLTD